MTYSRRIVDLDLGDFFGGDGSPYSAVPRPWAKPQLRRRRRGGDLAAAVSDSEGKHLRWLREQLGPCFVDPLICTTEPAAYRWKDDIAVMTLASFGS
ncbi:hypothetical protein [Kocuria tytonis]|uniref:hypothetical protein n=1 Tax=Kocuria tytonis TaxID=2054280 RepID=UPI0011C446E4|nr:hypothetical protein [Kocuria tytonis]